MIIFLVWFHTIMLVILAEIDIRKDIMSVGEMFLSNEKCSDSKKEYYFGEKIMMMIIAFGIISLFGFFVYFIAKRNTIVAALFCIIAGIAYLYIAIKQIVKMLFVPEKRSFTNTDISNFIYTYLGWWLLVLVVAALEEQGRILQKIMPQYEEIIEGGLFFLWCYFNILFAVGGLYIFLCSILNLVKDKANKFFHRVEEIGTKVSGLYDLWSQKKKLEGLKSYRLWKENSKRKVVYKGFMTVPLLVIDIGRIACMFVKYLFEMMIRFIFKAIFESISVLYMCAKNLWNRYQNNEWMYLIAQIAGIVSCFIVVILVLCGEYEEKTKSVYEFVGTIVLVPYFLGKIKGVGKASKEDEIKENVEKI